METRFLTRHDPAAESSEELLEIAKKLAREEFEREGEIAPTFMFHNPPGGFTSAMQVLWSSSQEKHHAAWGVRRMLNLIGAERYAVITESWFLSPQDPDDPRFADKKNMPTPSEHPDRQECVVVLVRDKTDQALSAFYIIERKPGRKPRLREINEMKGLDLVDMTFGKLGESGGH